jgi:dGTPase
VRRLIALMIEDVIAHSGRLIAQSGAASVEDIRRAGRPVIGFSPAMAAADQAIKGFLFERMYRHKRVVRIMGEAEAVVRALFGRYMETPRDVPWNLSGDDEERARQIADFIAGMTDRYALSEHGRLFDRTPELR